MQKLLTLLAPVALVVAASATAAAVPTAPSDSQPWWSPTASELAFQRVSPQLSGSDVLFTPATRGSEVDIIGAGSPRGFRPREGELLVEEAGGVTSIRDAQDHELGTVPGTDAAWSADGTHIAYLSNGTLWIADADGKNPQALQANVESAPADVVGPAWSPNGLWIALSRTTQLLLVATDGSGSRSLFTGDNANPSWSRDGWRVAFESAASGQATIMIATLAEGIPPAAFAGTGNNRFPQWSPTADTLAFLSDRDGVYGLYVEEVAIGAVATKLVSAVRPDSPPRWSPTGAQLAVAAAPDCKRFGIYVVDLSSKARPLLRSNQCRIDGTNGDDVIRSTPYYDLIYGYAGNDALYGAGGDDVIYGGPGNDSIGGGPGNDIIYGGSGKDILSGGTGNDTIYAGPGPDKIGCGPGNDTAYIGPGDTVRDCEHIHRSAAN